VKGTKALPNCAKNPMELREITINRLRRARRVVIKVGTSLVTGDDGAAATKRLNAIVESIASLRKEDRQVVLVSSGAIGLGRERLGLSKARLRDLVMRQACAAVGQSLLMHVYENLFAAHDVRIAQVLLTEDDFAVRQRYSNLRRAMEKLLKLGVVPIVNENDTVSTFELEYFDEQGRRVFSDNDRLAALITSKLEADVLVMLSNVDGFIAEEGVVPFVTHIDSNLKAQALGPSNDGRGGMVTKLEAAEIAMSAGGIAIIANGSRPKVLDQLFAGEGIGSTFVSDKRMGGKRRWIKYAADVRGKLIINPGARKAILDGKASLLSSGVISISEKFKAMDVISIVDHQGHELARGIANYSSQDTEALITSRSKAKARVLVTRNNIVLSD